MDFELIHLVFGLGLIPVFKKTRTDTNTPIIL